MAQLDWLGHVVWLTLWLWHERTLGWFQRVPLGWFLIVWGLLHLRNCHQITWDTVFRALDQSQSSSEEAVVVVVPWPCDVEGFVRVVSR